MQNFYQNGFRRLNVNFCHFKKYFVKNFCSSQQVDNNQNLKTEKKPFESILYVQHNNSALEIVLNEPKKLNSLDSKMIRSMLRRVKRYIPERESSTTDEEVSDTERKHLKNIIVPKIIIISGAGGKSFCAGGDIASLYNSKKNGEGDNIIKDFFRYEYMLDYLLTRMRPIQIALWNGYVMGGGVGISIHAPIRIATDNSLFSMPGIKLLF